ncbi:MAG: Flp family type IVb pilin [Alphaproteobacteria bacterium]
MWSSGDTGMFRSFRDEAGATAVEYGLIAMLVSVALIGSLWVYGEAVSEVYTTEAATIDGVVAEID